MPAVHAQEPTAPASPTEGVITNRFVGESEMMHGLLQMLARFSPYMVADYQPCVAPNSVGEVCGCFRGENTMGSDERGVRPNADLSMVCAFLVKYAKPAGIRLPEGVTWETLEELAMHSLVFAYSTHKANRLKVCADGRYWGSTDNGNHVWESSLWAMSVAYSAYFQWDRLSDSQRTRIYELLKAECNYELNRSIPTGYEGDTKAEENGWEADVLAAALGLFPSDELAPKWFDRLREFAINSYSHQSDQCDSTVVDPCYNRQTVADLYRGQNLYADYTLQNHRLFHTSYQNVVMQELGEAALALQLFQGDEPGWGRCDSPSGKWQSNALMHHNQEVMDSVLCWLALTDGELAMPNGNDWSLFLYDQLTSYTTQACFLRDANALMLENLAYKYIDARQRTTSDGSWLLRPDVGARRMGVEAHRVMMTYLMHLVCSTADLVPATWNDFREAHSRAMVLPCQNVVRAFTKDRFTTFSWSEGLKSYTGYIAANSVDRNKIIVPYRAHNTGNFLGWYTVSGKPVDATPVVSGNYRLMGDAYTMNGELNTNGFALNNRFVLYSTPGNAVIYQDHIIATENGTITHEAGGLMAVSVDEMTSLSRTLYYDGNKSETLDGTELRKFHTNWINIDNAVGVVSQSSKPMAFGDRHDNNSIMTAKLYPSYGDEVRLFRKGMVVDNRNIVYYSNISARETERMEQQLQLLADVVPEGWNAAIVPDPDGTHYLLLSHFRGSANEVSLSDIACPLGAPVFTAETVIHDGRSSACFQTDENTSIGQALKVFVRGSGIIRGRLVADNGEGVVLTASQKTKAVVSIVGNGRTLTRSLTLPTGKTIRLDVKNGKVVK